MSSDNETIEIDSEISKHESYIRELKIRRNALSPIFRLPPKIFCQIFELACEDDVQHLSLLWIKQTHVSHHWWNLAMSCPSLWTNLPLSHPHWTDEMLKRSKMASLILEADFASPLKPHEEAIRGALSNMSRVKDLTFIGLRYGDAVQKLMLDFPKSAPRLESLRIYVRPSRNIRLDMPDVHKITLHRDFLCDTPNLRRLELFRCEVCGNSQLLTSLTHLTLCNFSPTGPPTWTQFLDMLRRIPALQVLCLNLCLPRDESTANTTVTSLNTPIHFTHLQTLDIRDTASSIGPLLHAISIPPSAKIKLFCIGSASANYASILSAMSTIRPTSDTKPTPPILTLDFRLTGSRLVLRTYARVLTAMKIWYKSAQPNLELTLKWRKGHSEVNRAIELFFNALPLTDLDDLTIRFSRLDQPCVTIIRDTFGQLPRLRSVYCHDRMGMGSSSKIFLEALMATSASPSPIVVFPSLHTIALNDVIFNYYSIDTESLCNCLVERYERGLEVRKLSLNNCYQLTNDDVNRLREIVVDVEWDAVAKEYICDDGFDPSDFEIYESYDDD